MKVVCDWCHQIHMEDDSWYVERTRGYKLYNPETKEVRENNTQPEKLWFCTHYHRNEYLYGM